MNHDINEKIFPADPRITAYAFGELEGDELARIEAAVQADPELQAVVAELRAFGGQLATTLGDESAIAQEVTKRAPKKRRGLVIPFPLHYFAAAVAACFAVVVWVRQERTVSMPVSVAVTDVEPQVAREMAPAASPDFEKKSEVRALDYSVQATRKETSAPVSQPALFDKHLVARASANLTMPAMPELPTIGASSLGGFGFGAGTKSASAGMGAGSGTLGTGTGYNTGMGYGAGVGSISDSARGFTTMTSSPGRPRNRINALDARSGENSFRTVETEPLSTFSLDVDTASYSYVRRFLTSGRLPPRDAVRVEELINYFPYRYASPTGDVAFAAKLEVASAPWAPEHRLVRIGLKGRELTTASRPPANLVFLIDVSGSMNSANKLPLVKQSLRLLVERLRPDDRVAIVTYAGSSGLALPSTLASRKSEILASLDNLDSGGSTNGAMGIQLAYDIAKANFVANGGINRVILCTDGDFNVGVTDQHELVRLIEEKAKSRVFLSVLGFGMGNLKDGTLESLADKGNGTYGYIDNRREAEKIFVEQVEGTLATIAKDVKIQVEFNPSHVASYRLIGYANRMLAKEDFNNDAVDAGDIGAGHTVTALYEVVLAGVGGGVGVDPLKYQKAERRRDDTEVVPPSGELLTVKIRYKAPEGDVSKKLEFPLIDTGTDFAKADGEFRFAAAVAAWGMLLRDSPHKGSATFDQVAGWAEDGLGNDEGGYRAEFIQLVRRSAELSAR